jgi:hypothetical protein
LVQDRPPNLFLDGVERVMPRRNKKFVTPLSSYTAAD